MKFYSFLNSAIIRAAIPPAAKARMLFPQFERKNDVLASLASSCAAAVFRRLSLVRVCLRLCWSDEQVRSYSTIFCCKLSQSAYTIIESFPALITVALALPLLEEYCAPLGRVAMESMLMARAACDAAMASVLSILSV